MMRVRWAFPLGVACLLVTGGARGEELDRADFGGKLQLGAWSSSRSLDGANDLKTGTVSLWAKARLDSNIRLYSDLRAGGPEFFAGNQHGALREAYAVYSFDNSDVRIGRMLIPWGRADRINPTDSLVSRDFRWLAPEEEDQRMGNTGFQWRSQLGTATASVVWLPDMRASRVPLPRALQAQTAVNNSMGSDNYGLKVERSAAGWDGSISYYHGVDTSPSLELLGGNATKALELRNFKIRRLGSDFAASADAFTFRGEWAYTMNEAPSGSLAALAGNRFMGVLGLERQFNEGLNVNIQVFYKRTDHVLVDRVGVPPPVLEAHDLVAQQSVQSLPGMALRVDKKLWDETLDLELTGAAYAKHQGSAWRPRVRKSFGDSTTLAIGVDCFLGAPTSMLGSLRANRAAFAELNALF